MTPTQKPIFGAKSPGIHWSGDLLHIGLTLTLWRVYRYMRLPDQG